MKCFFNDLYILKLKELKENNLKYKLKTLDKQ